MSSGAAESPDRDAEKTAKFFVHLWAEAVLRHIERVRTCRRQFDHSVEVAVSAFFGPGDPAGALEQVDEDFRTRWAEEHTLVWSAHQMEQWTRRLAKERGEKQQRMDRMLVNVRSALEHLDKAGLSEIYAYVKDLDAKNTRSLRELPDMKLMIGTSGDLLFGLLKPAVIEESARTLVQSIDRERESEAEAAELAHFEDDDYDEDYDEDG